MTKKQLIETAVKYVYREISEDVFLTAVEAYSSASNDGKSIVSDSLPPEKVDKLLQMQIEECRVYIDRRSRDFGQSSYQLNEWFGEIVPVAWRQ